ncbi:hypothetical protein AB0M02_02350 [Actinoplanes sp. NPDC051861]|uniref:hypothetical protein n=1 Tax=Actinoplanes sp. NPDC051861 TaxID=3155170 RepID=UPI003420C99F
MKPLRRRFSQFFVIAFMAALSMVATTGPAGAAGRSLWNCSPFGEGYKYACTTITSAPAGGVQVLDRYTNQIYTLRNGNSIALLSWYNDTSGQCGVFGNPYVWIIAWQNQGYHQAFIGDYYLATGRASTWKLFTDDWGALGNRAHARGDGTGTCDIFPNY